MLITIMKLGSDGEDPDDDNNGVLDSEQELLCFVGEEQMTWDRDNDGIVNWMDDDWDGDGRSNQIELNAITIYLGLGSAMMV